MIITQTPLRISFAGGGTDFEEFWREHGGGVVSSAIDKYVYVIVKERFDDLIVLNYSRKERVSVVRKIEHDLIREAMRMTNARKGVEITTLADIPSRGSGLGSSSTVTVGLLHALYSFSGELVTAERLAREACEIEIEILGSPIGIQDQYIAAYGGLRHFRFHKDGTVGGEKVMLAPRNHLVLSSRLLLFYLNRTRKSATILSKQKESMSDNIDSLCQMRDLAFSLFNDLTDENLDILGETMHRGWLLKKSLSENVTDKKINAYYEAAIQAGALGGKVAGAGGGGFLLLYVPRDKQDGVREAMGRKNLRELPFTLDPNGSRVILNQRRPGWK